MNAIPVLTQVVSHRLMREVARKQALERMQLLSIQLEASEAAGDAARTLTILAQMDEPFRVLKNYREVRS